MNFSVPNTIKKILDTPGMDRARLSEMLDVDQSAISMWISGKRSPSPLQCLALASLAKGEDQDNFIRLSGTSDAVLKRIAEVVGADTTKTIQPEKEALLKWFENPPEEIDRAIAQAVRVRLTTIGNSKGKPKGKNVLV